MGIKKDVKTKEAGKDYKPKDEYYQEQGGKKKTVKKPVKKADAPLFQHTSKPLTEREFKMKDKAPSWGEQKNVVTPKSKIAIKPKKNKAIPRCVNCDQYIYSHDEAGNIMRDVGGNPIGANRGHLGNCPHCGEDWSHVSPGKRAMEESQWNEFKQQNPEKLVDTKHIRKGMTSTSPTFKCDNCGTMTNNVDDKHQCPNCRNRFSRLIQRSKQDKTPNFKSGPIEEVGMKKAWDKYKLKKDVIAEDDTLPANYPNSNYQKLWEQLEDKENKPPLDVREPRVKLNPEERKEKKLKNVMAATPETPVYTRDEVTGIANSMRPVLGKPLRKPTNPRHAEMEDVKIKDQLNTLWEDTGTKPMTTEQVRKNMQQMYGAPMEDLPETESPPPIYYKTIEPTKKKEKV
jgi:Zn finger protein HypA/HybF involved in hydrogenase expression